MATLYWEVPADLYFEAAALVMEADELSTLGARDKLDEVKDKLLRIPGYPHNRTPEDLVVLIPKGARIFVERVSDTPTN